MEDNIDIGNSSDKEIPSINSEGGGDGATPNGQVDLTKYVPKDDYLNAQAFGTKSRQNEIAMAIKLVEKDSESLHTIEDSKIKDAVTKQLLWMSYAEANAVMGNNFSISSTSSNGDDSSGNDNSNGQGNSNIERELKLLKYKESIRETESAIANFQSKNPNFFSWDSEGMVNAIKEELANISSSLPIDERVRRAATVSLWNPSDKESLAYNLLLSWVASNGRNSTTSDADAAKAKIHTFQNELRSYMGLKQK